MMSLRGRYLTTADLPGSTDNRVPVMGRWKAFSAEMKADKLNILIVIGYIVLALLAITIVIHFLWAQLGTAAYLKSPITIGLYASLILLAVPVLIGVLPLSGRIYKRRYGDV